MSTSLLLLAALFTVAMAMVGWAALTLGDPARPYSRRPLPYPRNAAKIKRLPRHAQWTTEGSTTRLSPPPGEDGPATPDVYNWPGRLLD